MTCCIWQPATHAYRIVLYKLFKLNIKARCKIPEFLNKPLIDTSYCIQHRLELKYFHFAQLCFMQPAHQPKNGTIIHDGYMIVNSE